MISGIRGRILCLIAAAFFFAGARAAEPAGPAAAKQPADPAAPTATTRDALVYKDGDRLQGKLLERAGDTIVFKSDRFGVVRVPAAAAVDILA